MSTPQHPEYEEVQKGRTVRCFVCGGAGHSSAMAMIPRPRPFLGYAYRYVHLCCLAPTMKGAGYSYVDADDDWRHEMQRIFDSRTTQSAKVARAAPVPAAPSPEQQEAQP